MYGARPYQPQASIDFLWKAKNDGEKLSCSWCFRPVSAPSYSCIQCKFFIHKSCAKLSIKEDPTLCTRDILIPSPQKTHTINMLGSCENCDQNNLRALPTIVPSANSTLALNTLCYYLLQMVGHEHSYMLHRPTWFTCNACGETGNDNVIYMNHLPTLGPLKGCCYAMHDH